MPPRLIINADDFGLTPGVNRSIEELHRAGVLSSATLMANGVSFDEAVAIARRNPHLGVGCHVVLTDGSPVSPPGSVPSLLAAGTGTFRPKLLEFAAAALRRQLRPDDIRREALAQIRRLQHAGLRVTHLDTHKHAHLFPSILAPLAEAALEAGVPALRNPFEPRWSVSLAHGSLLRRLQVRALGTLEPGFHSAIANGTPSLLTPDGTIGVSATGDLNPTSLRQILQALPEGTWELVCHPGYNDDALASVSTRLREHRVVEHRALLEVIPQILAQPSPPALIHYGDLAAQASGYLGQIAAASDPSRSTP